MQAPASVADFLAQKRIAVLGVSREKQSPANLIYRKLKGQGYDVVAVNPRTEEAEGDRCYADLTSVPGDIDGVMAVTPPDAGKAVVDACVAKGVPRLWFHRSFGGGSVSDDAVALAKEKGLSVIPGGCPMMFSEPVDFGHRCMRFLLGWRRKLS